MRESKRNHLVFKKLPLFMAVATCLYGTAALAQDQSEEDADQQEQSAPQAPAQATELERITVTGSLLRRVEFDSVSPVQVITADTSVAVGMVDTAEFLQKSSVAAGSTQINNQFSGFVVEGGTGVQTVNLRGLGAQRTAVLLNGARPGPAGTRGQVLAFDLNVIPQSIVQRIEIVKDGSSSIYGSDALAGVVNIITRKNIDRPEITVSGRVPFNGGGESFTASGATGWNFDNGNLMVAAEYYVHKPLRVGDRRFFRCTQDMVWDDNGNRIDREDRSILAGTSLAGCSGTNLYANTVIDAFTGVRYIPSPDGVTIGMIPGYRPRVSTSWTHPSGAGFEDVLNFDFYNDVQVIDRQERMSVYANADFSFGNVNWNTEFLFNRRQTDTHRLRQFFPVTGGATAPAIYRYANDPTFVTPVPSGVAQPIMPMIMPQSIEVDYYYLNTKLDGLFGFTDTWAWQGNASYSRSSGDYGIFTIVGSRSGDVTWSDDAPVLDYFSPRYLSGEGMAELAATIGDWDWGNTVYDQFVFNAVATGELFNLPAGAVGAAIGVEYRDFSIDDAPGPYEMAQDRWGLSSAEPTVGDDKVKEIFAEIEVPLLKGVPGFESLVWNMSGRWFDYDSVGESDNVWKTGLSWQIIPSVRVRATKGTSYRAPGLYELYLGNLSSFTAQLGLDPCIGWADPANNRSPQTQANCAAAGIPGNYVGNASSAQVFQGGGAGFLNPETSEAFTAGIVWTPSFAPLSVALDYFDYEVSDEIASLGAGAIVAGCYSGQVYPNSFCDMLVRNAPDHPIAPNKIEEVYASYVNVNKQKVRGYDLLLRYDNDFSFGKVEVEGQFTYTTEDYRRVFSASASDGLATNDRNGDISRPELVGNLRGALKRGDFAYTWQVDYVGETETLNQSDRFTYQARPNSIRDNIAEARFYHHASIRYEQPDWSLLVGIRNVFDAKPAEISGGFNPAYSRYGNVPAFATQYDWYGRSLFVRYNYKF
ncbi:MAG TPA: TonB-dependent receptor [Gammaproteobacteria bacterium]|nr:TonB-dependent receptor [Gammaproteobacteria bacterium]